MDHEKINKEHVEDILPLTPLQEGMLFTYISQPDSDMYYEYLNIELEGKIQNETFKQAWCAVFQANEMLRVRYVFGESVEKPLLIILKNADVHIDLYDLASKNPVEQEEMILGIKSWDKQHKINLRRETMRIRLCKLSENNYKMLIYSHHIVFDGWSSIVLINDFMNAYHNLDINSGLEISRKTKYREYLRWRGQQDKNEEKKFWQRYLANMPEEIQLPFRNRTPKYNSADENNKYEYRLSNELEKKIRRFLFVEAQTISVLFYTAWAILLHKYNQLDDVVFGTTVSGRNAYIPGFDKMVGMFINTLPLRIKFSSELTVAQLMEQIAKMLIERKQYESTALSDVVAYSPLKKSSLFNSILVVQNYPFHIGGDQIKLRSFSADEQTNFDLAIQIEEMEEHIKIIVLHSEAYNSSSSGVLIEYLVAIIGQILNESQRLIGEVESPFQIDEMSASIVRTQINQHQYSPLKLAISATFTAEQIENHVAWWCRQFDYDAHITFSTVNQVIQDLLDPQSSLSVNTDINALLIRFEDWLQQEDSSGAAEKCEKLRKQYDFLLKALTQRSRTVSYIIVIFPFYRQSISDPMLSDVFSQLYSRWKKDLSALENMYVLDLNDSARKYNVVEVFDLVNNIQAQPLFMEEYYAVIGAEIARTIVAVKKQDFKVIVLDCDNTLWGGICGEDHSAGVKLEKHYKELQRFFLQKKEEGFLLALCSKNIHEDVEEVFKNSNGMILQENDFVMMKINWNSKSQNIKELSAALNLGLDSFIFIDDSAIECGEVRHSCPEVLTLQLPEQAEQIPDFLNDVWAFDKLFVTDEDHNRKELYSQQENRQLVYSSSVSLSDFLSMLELRMSFNKSTKEELPRIAQLIQRTNQFNATANRRDLQQVRLFMDTPNTNCWSIEVADKFGEYGLVGVVITKETKDELLLDTLLLSCRVLSRNVEDAIFYCIQLYCNENRISRIMVPYLQTKRNTMVRDFLQRSGFTVTENTTENGEVLFSAPSDKMDLQNQYVTSYYRSRYEKAIVDKPTFAVLDHVAIAVHNIDDRVNHYKPFGYSCGQTVYDQKQNVYLNYLTNDNAVALELVAPFDESSPCKNELNKNGEIPYHLCFKVDDISKFLATLCAKSVEFEVISNKKQAVLFNNCHVMFIFVKYVGLVELLEDCIAVDMRQSAPEGMCVIKLAVEDIEEAERFFTIVKNQYIENISEYGNRTVIKIHDNAYLELVAPEKEKEAEQIFEKNGPHLYKICFECADLKSLEKRLTGEEIRENQTQELVCSHEETMDLLFFRKINYLAFCQTHKQVITGKFSWIDSKLLEKDQLHKKHLLPLFYNTGASLLSLSVSNQKMQELYNSDYIAPSGHVEEKLAEIWSNLLGVSPIGVNDHFFKIGGHSLKAINLVSQIYKNFKIKIPIDQIFEKPTIRKLAHYLGDLQTEHVQEIQPIEKREYYPLSPAQKRTYMMDKYAENSSAYHMTSAFEIVGSLDYLKLDHALTQIVERHESLRTSFSIMNSEFVQIVHDGVKIAAEHRFIEIQEEDQVVKDAVEGAIQDFIHPFELNSVPLIRIQVLHINNNKLFLLCDMHHIIADGTSASIFLRELIALYQGQTLTELKLSYKDFVIWQQNMLQSNEIKRQEQYWLETFSDEVPVLNMATDFIRPLVPCYEGETQEIRLSEEQLMDALKQLGYETESTLFIILLAIYNILLSKYTGQEDIVVGSPIEGRSNADSGNIVGMFVNTLALRNYPVADVTFRVFLQTVNAQCLRAYENQDYQFEDLVEKLGIQRDASRNPMFDTMIVMQNEEPLISFSGVTLIPYNFKSNTTKFDIVLNITNRGSHIGLYMEYCKSLYKKDTIRQLLKHYVNILEEVVQTPDVLIRDIEMLTVSEKQQITRDFNNTVRTPYNNLKSLCELFEEQVEKRPDQVALLSDTVTLTYLQLNEKANRVAWKLKEAGADENTIIGVISNRSIEMIIAVYGILKAGAVYLLIDQEYPQKRVAYMIENSDCAILLTRTGMNASAPAGMKVFELDQIINDDSLPVNNLGLQYDENRLIYLMYTSGSTGNPKGVMVRANSFMNLLDWYTNEFCINHNDCNLLMSPISFDLTQKNFFVPLLAGGKLYVLESEIYDYNKIARIIYQNKITMLNCTPNAFYPLVEFSSNNMYAYQWVLRYVFLGGEPIHAGRLKAWVEKSGYTCEIVNTYGPTECTDVCAFYRVAKEEITSLSQLPIGRPVWNNTMYILDQHKKPVPIGVAGEVYIGGICVSNGYCNNPTMTEDKFVRVAEQCDGNLYRTGDYAMWLANGTIQFMGRMDTQVKISGQRLEIDEIVSCLLDIPFIQEAVVSVRKDHVKSNYLCAYLVTSKGFTAAEIRACLSAYLPSYMIPAFFVRIDSIPLTPNKKTDYNALPEPAMASAEKHVMPQDETEEIILNIWQEVLGITKISVHSNFFDIGGNSLKMFQVQNELQKKFALEISIVDLFQYPTIRDIAGRLHNKNDKQSEKASSMKYRIQKRNAYNKKVKKMLEEAKFETI